MFQSLMMQLSLRDIKDLIMELSLWELKRYMATYYDREDKRIADEEKRIAQRIADEDNLRMEFKEGDRLCEDR